MLKRNLGNNVNKETSIVKGWFCDPKTSFPLNGEGYTPAKNPVLGCVTEHLLHTWDGCLDDPFQRFDLMCQRWSDDSSLQTDFEGSPGHQIVIGDRRCGLDLKCRF